MGAQRFYARLEDLPKILPVFPLSGALLLPGGVLPLNVFEPRYLEMVEDALGAGRLIGMIQPLSEERLAEDNPPLYQVGCAGRISHFSETGDGRFLITLTGLGRFAVAGEQDMVKGYRRFAIDWEPYRADLEDGETPVFDRVQMIAILKAFASLQDMDINWKAVEEASDQALTIGLPMACPFDPREKQALLECANASDRAAMLIALMEMALAEGLSKKNLSKQ